MFTICDLNMPLAYLSDLLDELNSVNTSLWGGHNRLWLSDKLKLLIKEEYLWQSKLGNAELNVAYFEALYWEQ
jgi:hypothetical protein